MSVVKKVTDRTENHDRVLNIRQDVSPTPGPGLVGTHPSARCSGLSYLPSVRCSLAAHAPGQRVQRALKACPLPASSCSKAPLSEHVTELELHVRVLGSFLPPRGKTGKE